MDHQEAVRRGAVEKYLLGEMSPEERAEFEEHFFGCTECAAELKATAAFLDGAKRVFARDSAANSLAPVGTVTPVRNVAPVRNQSRFAWAWRPAVLSPAFSFLLLLIAYQNIIVLPRLEAKLAVAHKPEVLASLSLIGGNSRGGTLPTIGVAQGQPLLLMLDIPSSSAAAVTCVLLAPSGEVLARVPVRAEATKDTIGLRIPAAVWLSGDYTLIVQSRSPSDHADTREPASELARYRFSLIATTRVPSP